MSSIPSPAPRDREHRFARPHLVIVSTLEELRSLEIGCPDLRTGAAHSDIFTSFLRVLERFQVIFGRLSFFFDRDWDHFCIVLCFRWKKSKCFAFWFKISFGWKSLVDPPEKEKKPKETDNKRYRWCFCGLKYLRVGSTIADVPNYWQLQWQITPNTSAENSVRINWIEHILVWGKDTIEWWPQWYVRKSISI